MSSAGKQFVIVKGELRIDGSSGFSESNALISFVGDFQTKLGQIRCYGFGANSYLLLDGSATQGIVFRTTQSQGDGYYLGGVGDQFMLEVLPTVVRTKYLQVAPQQTAYNSTFDGSVILQVSKPNTLKASSLRNSLIDVALNSWKIGETMQMTLGASPNSGTCAWSYTLPTTTSSSAADNYSSFSMCRNSTYYENMRMLTTGEVIFPHNVYCSEKLTTATVQATNWIGLPSLNPADLLPLTLDKVNSRVGIHALNPAHTLHVGGDARIDGPLAAFDADFTGDVAISGDLNADNIFVQGITATGTVTADTIVANSYVIPPLTLNTIYNRVGINQSNPLEALDVTGNVQVSGNILASEVYGNDVIATNVTTQTINAGTYLNLPSPDILPITLDQVNNRVGINNTNPLTTLDVHGDARIYSSLDIYQQYSLHTPFGAGNDFFITPILSDGTLDNAKQFTFTGSTGSITVPGTATINDINCRSVSGSTALLTCVTVDPNGAKAGNPGSLALRTTGQLYLKETGTGNTGWTEMKPAYVPTNQFVQQTGTKTLTNNAIINVISAALPLNSTVIVTAQLTFACDTTADVDLLYCGIAPEPTAFYTEKTSVALPVALYSSSNDGVKMLRLANGPSGANYTRTFTTVCTTAAVALTAYLNARVRQIGTSATIYVTKAFLQVTKIA